MISRHEDRERLAPALAKAVAPAYLLPAVQAFAVAQFTSNEALATASYTTIAVPSAAAAVVLTMGGRLADRRQRRRGRLRGIGAARAALVGAFTGAALAAVAATVLVTNQVFDPSLFGQAVPSAAVGGAITATTWALRRNRRFRRQATEDPVNAGPGGTGRTRPTAAVSVGVAGVR